MSIRPRSSITPLVLTMTVLVGIATLMDVLMGPGSQMSTEERYNAAAAALIACGHTEAIWALQYKWYCGGCTAEAVLAAPLFGLFGPTVLAWKWVVGGIHVAMVSAGVAIAGRSAGARAALVFAGLMLAAPGFYRELALTGFGNHAESTFFPFAGAAVMLFAHRRSETIKVMAALVAGVLMGVGIWFSPTAIHGLLAVLIIAVAAGPVSSGAFLVGLPIGLIPFVSYFRAIGIARIPAAQWWTTLELAPPSAMFRWLWGDFLHAQLWPDVGSVGSSMWWVSLMMVAVIGSWAMATRTERPWGVRFFVPLAILGLVAGYMLRFDQWSDNPHIVGYDAFNLRYRAPLFPLMALGAALSSGAMEENSGLRKLCAGFVVALIAVGFVFRVQGWNVDTPPVHRQAAVSIDGRIDASVPEGDPPTRLDRAMGRPQDLHAALAFIDSHEDGLSECRALHVAELGRRVGVGLVDGRNAVDLAPGLSRGATLEGAELTAFVRGLAAPFVNQVGASKSDWPVVKPVLEQAVPGLAKAVTAELRARGHPSP
jgi:hypothetical protein